ncbi:YmaF family protein [Aureibacillus halotolerans]|uniref:YmaF-like protein n=1 Tax=Aureibacillus halotolerans TaxID=1508390 RepID=A0A4R6U3S0_9BACI|nr:YmaF family protein [Aureibacillus halotolerans]TDQ40326.1 YmaF-like protein [Aureibacillus halotolerans]
MLAKAHAHYFGVYSTVDAGHFHGVNTFVFEANGNAEDGHVHTYTGVTSFANGHFHAFSGTTGPAIPVGATSHIHKIKGCVRHTFANDKEGMFGGIVYSNQPKLVHRHCYEGYTGYPLGER